MTSDAGATDPAPLPQRVPLTLAESLNARSDGELAALFAARPDLLRMIPDDFPGLAAACASPLSVRLAWHRLTRLERQVIEVLVVLPAPVSASDLIRATAAEDATASQAVRAAVGRLRDLALVWGGETELRAVSGLVQLIGPAPCGLDTTDRRAWPRIARYLSHPAELLDELATAPAGARAVLDRLVWGPPRGTVANAYRPVSAASARTPVEWLLARDLLVPADRDSVVLPREIALLLRNGRFVAELALPPGPPVRSDAAPIADADATAGLHALMFTRATEEFLAIIDSGEIRLLRTGGIYQRDATSIARRMRMSVGEVALVADVAWVAGLIGIDAEAGVWRLTRTVDVWRTSPEPRKWAALAMAWRSSGAHAPLAAATDTDHRILSDALNSPGIADLRALALTLARSAPPGAPIDPQRLAVAVDWTRPQVAGRDLSNVLAGILADGETIGLLGRGALSAAGRILAGPGTVADLAAAVAWPALVDRVLLQADLTATAPGPMTQHAQERLSLFAELESSGAGSVYRFSGASLARAFDAGMGAGEVLAELQQLSVTPVPPTVESLVSDVGRRHGRVRVQTAASVVTTDDDVSLSAALSEKSLARLRLRRIAPGVAISPQPAAEVASALRQAGIAAVSADTARAARPRRLAPPRPVSTEHPDDDYLAAAVRSLRAGQAARIALEGPAQVSPMTPHDLVDLLTDAIRSQRAVWLDFADPTGQRKVRMVEPLTLRQGQLAGFDHREQRVTSFPLSRIAGIAVVEPEG